MNTKIWTNLCARAAMVGALALALAPTAAMGAAARAPQLEVAVTGAATIARGGAADVTLAYTCPPRYGGSRGYAIVSLEITQRLAGGPVDGLDTGGDAAYLQCDGLSHTAHRVVLPYPAGSGPARAFGAGSVATVTANVLACDAAEVNCVEPTVVAYVRLRAASASNPNNQPAAASATLRPNGSVAVRVAHGCGPAQNGSLSVAGLSERVGGGLAATSAYQSSTLCRAGFMRTVVHPGGTPVFAPGTAYVVASWSVCGQRRCNEGDLQGTVVIRG
jgi:hypothetical protein